MSTTVTIYASADGQLFSTDSGSGNGAATWNAARNGTDTVNVNTSGTEITSQWADVVSGYFAIESFLLFDTSALAGKTIVSAALHLANGTVSSPSATATENASEKTIARTHSWSTLTSADWVPGGTPTGVKVAEVANSVPAAGAALAYIALTDVALAANINKTGNTGLVVYQERIESGTDPRNPPVDGLYGKWAFKSRDYNGASHAPKLVITYNDPTPSGGKMFAVFVEALGALWQRLKSWLELAGPACRLA